LKTKIIHWQHAARTLLETPLLQRFFFDKVFISLVYWLFFPLLLLASVLWTFVSHFKRKFAEKRGLKLEKIEKFVTKSVEEIEILRISIGNFVVGGSGKSPYVRYVLEKNLQEGVFCVLLSRGINVNSSNDLSDENREHFEILRSVLSNAQFENLRILQGRNRGRDFELRKSEFGVQASLNACSRMLVVADDALQHLSWKRNIDVCLWPGQILTNVPWVCLPLGIFREGNPLQKKDSLLAIEKHVVWNKEDALQLLANGVLENRIELMYKRTTWYKWNSSHFLETCTLLNFIENARSIASVRIGIVFGIANPSSLLQQLQEEIRVAGLPEPLVCLLLPDHGSLSEASIVALSACDVIVTTCKDVCRWIHIPDVKRWNCFAISATVEVVDGKGAEYGTWAEFKNSFS
jgi:tetraacyldisaccharide 4'-kinase